jgi:hypothetical protein
MKQTKFLLFGLSAAALVFSACSGSVNVNTTTSNAANKPNAVVTATPAKNTAADTPVSSPTPAANANKAANASKSDDSSDAAPITGELQKGNAESLILYVGEETGDYAAYCFANDSDAGRAILAACKDRERCEVTGETGEGSCKVPGLEADLSDSGRIVKVVSAKPLGKKK